MSEDKIKVLKEYLDYHTKDDVYEKLLPATQEALRCIEAMLEENQQLKEMFEDSKTYGKQFLYKHNKNLLEANERLSRKNEQLKEENEELSEDKTSKIILLGKCRLERDKYKEVIEEVREYTNDKLFDDYTYCSYEDVKQNINEILEKSKENK